MAATCVAFGQSVPALARAILSAGVRPAAPTRLSLDAAPSIPRVFLLDPTLLDDTRKRVRAGDRALDQALARLVTDARKALESGPFSVVDKQTTPPRGDKHDYMSQAPYFWPNPKTPN